MDPYLTTDKDNRFTEDGHEILNPTPIQPPLGYKPTLSLAEQIRQQVHAQKKLLELSLQETEEEADDFEIEDDPQPVSRWENDLIPSIKETRSRLRELEAQEKLYADAEAAQKKAREVPDPRAKPSSEPAGGEEGGQ